MKDPKSKCCNADMTVHEADEGTNFYVCVKCKSPTDPRIENWEQEFENLFPRHTEIQKQYITRLIEICKK